MDSKEVWHVTPVRELCKGSLKNRGYKIKDHLQGRDDISLLAGITKHQKVNSYDIFVILYPSSTYSVPLLSVKSI